MTDEPLPTIAIGIPIERNIHQHAFWSLMRIAQQGWEFLALGYSRTDVARNRMAQALLKGPWSHLLMLDSDMLHPVDIVNRLGSRAAQHPECRVLSALYFRRGQPFDPLAFVRDDEGHLRTIGEWPQGLVKVAAVGTGAMLIHRSVFEQLPPPWFTYSYVPGTMETSSEDIEFCELCEKNGIDIWVDTTVVVPHLTDRAITEQTFRHWVADHPGDSRAGTVPVLVTRERAEGR
jgi:hypothetical protein